MQLVAIEPAHRSDRWELSTSTGLVFQGEGDGHLTAFNSETGEIVWQILDLKWPWKAQRLENGNTLIADAGSNRVFEVNTEKQETWAIENIGPEKSELFDNLGPVYVQRINNGNTYQYFKRNSLVYLSNFVLSCIKGYWLQPQ